MPQKRACDLCISRKVKCSGSWPCDTCRGAVRRVKCTYLKPPRKRGPKFRRVNNDHDGEQETHTGVANEGPLDDGQYDDTIQREIAEPRASESISKAVLVPILHLYRQYSYSVWPVVNADALLERIEDVDPENTSHEEENVACLVTALCAATMAQLQMAPVMDGGRKVDSTVLAQACLRIRSRCNSHREHLDISSILVSFFLHVYHAKVNQRKSAMMYIQEAISGSRILRLDEGSMADDGFRSFEIDDQFIANKELVFPLLWVSERGYAMHLGLSPSYVDPLSLEGLENNPNADVHAKGLLDLTRLFVAFNRVSIRRRSQVELSPIMGLVDTEEKLSMLGLNLVDDVSTRTADCHITREWMRTILWQEALSLGLLSSSSNTSVMTFAFPAQVGRNLLHSLRCFSETDLLPLGRDQLLKCFEVANSLADTVLLTSPASHSGFDLGPQDFLHALYQKLQPFLEQDSFLNSILRNKTAEVLVTSPARLLTRQIDSRELNWDFYQLAEESRNHSSRPEEILDEAYSTSDIANEYLVYPTNGA